MTFTELDDIIAGTGRRALASRFIAALLDALDSGCEGVDLDQFETDSGYIRTNIRNVATYLRERGVVNVFYYREGADDDLRIYTTESSSGRWAKQHYRLSSKVKSMFRRNL